MKLLVRVSAALITILCVGEVAALAVGRLIYRDPFAPYEALMPGQPIASASRAGHCDAEPVGDGPEFIRCVAHLDDPVFVSVTATGNQDTIIQTAFQVKDLRVGDVVVRWRTPELVTNYRYLVYVYWHDDGLFATIHPAGQRERFNYQLLVKVLLISREPRFLVTPSG